MAVRDGQPRIDPAELMRAVREADRAALFIEPRILRRVIKQDQRLTGIGFQVPHAHVYTIDRERLLAIADRLFVINFGQPIALGKPQAVMADPEVQRVYLGVEA